MGLSAIFVHKIQVSSANLIEKGYFVIQLKFRLVNRLIQVVNIQYYSELAPKNRAIIRAY